MTKLIALICLLVTAGLIYTHADDEVLTVNPDKSITKSQVVLYADIKKDQDEDGTAEAALIDQIGQLQDQINQRQAQLDLIRARMAKRKAVLNQVLPVDVQAEELVP